MQTPRYSVKQTSSSVPLCSTWTVHNSLDNVDTHLPLMQACPPPLIDSTTGHYNSIDSHSSSLWLAFLASVQQGRALECAFVALNSTGMHCHAYWKYTGSLRNTDASIIRTCSSSPLVFAIEEFHHMSTQHTQWMLCVEWGSTNTDWHINLHRVKTLHTHEV